MSRVLSPFPLFLEPLDSTAAIFLHFLFQFALSDWRYSLNLPFFSFFWLPDGFDHPFDRFSGPFPFPPMC